MGPPLWVHVWVVATPCPKLWVHLYGSTIMGPCLGRRGATGSHWETLGATGGYWDPLRSYYGLLGGSENHWGYWEPLGAIGATGSHWELLGLLGSHWDPLRLLRTTRSNWEPLGTIGGHWGLSALNACVFLRNKLSLGKMHDMNGSGFN